MFTKINGKKVYLWRAVDEDGQTVDVLVQERRNKKAVKRCIKKLRKQISTAIWSVTTDKLKSDIKPISARFPMAKHKNAQYENNRAENSHQVSRLREKKMRRFKSLKQAQLFANNLG